MGISKMFKLFFSTTESVVPTYAILKLAQIILHVMVALLILKVSKFVRLVAGIFKGIRIIFFDNLIRCIKSHYYKLA
jgi:hypothetical protein